jgi:hypothetical protein
VLAAVQAQVRALVRQLGMLTEYKPKPANIEVEAPVRYSGIHPVSGEINLVAACAELLGWRPAPATAIELEGRLPAGVSFADGCDVLLAEVTSQDRSLHGRLTKEMRHAGPKFVLRAQYCGDRRPRRAVLSVRSEGTPPVEQHFDVEFREIEDRWETVVFLGPIELGLAPGKPFVPPRLELWPLDESGVAELAATLVELLDDNEADVRRGAAAALCKYGSATPEPQRARVKAAFERMAASQDELERRTGREALARLFPAEAGTP